MRWLKAAAASADDLGVANIDVYDANDPLQRDYDEAIRLAQGGQHDNLPKRARFLVRHQLAAQALKRFPDLDVAECGCWKGHSTLMTAWLIERVGATGRFAVLDSFDGLSDFTDADRAGASDANQEARRQAAFRSDLDAFKALMAPYAFVDIYPGWIPDRFKEVEGRSYGFVSIDVDMHDPTLASLEFFHPRMPAGGIIYLDDYGYKNFPGARAAADAFFAKHPPSFFLRLPSGAAFAVK